MGSGEVVGGWKEEGGGVTDARKTSSRPPFPFRDLLLVETLRARRSTVVVAERGGGGRGGGTVGTSRGGRSSWGNFSVRVRCTEVDQTGDEEGKADNDTGGAVRRGGGVGRFPLLISSSSSSGSSMGSTTTFRSVMISVALLPGSHF